MGTRASPAILQSCTPARLLLALLQVYCTPLVGVWVKGPTSLLHPLVSSACLKYYYCSTLLDRVVQSDGAFLLLLAPEGKLWRLSGDVCGAGHR